MPSIARDSGKLRLGAIALVPALALAALLPASTMAQDDANSSAIINVNVIPMDSERVLEDQTVLVVDGRVSQIGHAGDASIPDGAQVIDAQGGFLIPGLVNSHFHVSGDPNRLALTLGNGQTTVTALNASPDDLELAAEVDAGQRFGPRVITAPNLSGLLPVSEYAVRRLDAATAPLFFLDFDAFGLTFEAEKGREFVIRAHEAGADAIKINVFVNREVFDAVVEEADKLGLPVLGHVSSQIGLEHFIEAGAGVHHFSEVAPYFSRSSIQGLPVQKWEFDQLEEKLPRLVELMVDHDQWFTPTLTIAAQVARIFEDETAVKSARRLRYLDPATLRSLEDPANNLLYANIGDAADNPGLGDAVLAFNERLIGELHEAGVPLLAGTDATAVPWTVPGFELAEEIELFVDYGLTPFEALETATRLPAAYWGQDDEWGTIEVGKEADLLLLHSDPLLDISAVRDMAGVMVGGVWVPQAEMQAMLDDVAASYVVSSAIEMEPWANVVLGIAGVAPSGWAEIDDGVFTRSDPDSDPTFLVQLAAPAEAADALAASVLENFGAADLGEAVDSFEIGDMTWEVFMPQGELGIVVALATTDEAAFLVGLASLPDEIETLTDSVLQPAVIAFTSKS